jgi:hypothetical protein
MVTNLDTLPGRNLHPHRGTLPLPLMPSTPSGSPGQAGPEPNVFVCVLRSPTCTPCEPETTTAYLPAWPVLLPSR